MELPPVLQLLTSEIPASKLAVDNVRRLIKDKGFLKEASTQAKVCVQRNTFSPAESSPADDSFTVYPSASLNPLTDLGKCNSHNCRIVQAESFARSIGLYCDKAVLTDYITQNFLSPNLSSDDAGEIFSDLQALNILMPMVREGIIRFSQPVGDMCPECCKRITGKLSERLWKLILKDGRAEFSPNDEEGFSCHVSSSLHVADGKSIHTEYKLTASEAKTIPSILRPISLKNLPKASLNLVKTRTIRSLLRETRLVCEEAKAAADTAAVLVTNSRQDVVALRATDKGSFSKSFEDWEDLRSVPLPWVSHLSVEEVIRLREKAGDALPKFRDKMSRELFSIPANVDDPDKFSRQVVKRLREEVHELDADLNAAAMKTGHAGHIGLATTGLSCIIYGIGASDPTAISVGTALTVSLASMYHPTKNAHAEYAHLKTRPAYVLLSAREIIRGR